MNKKAERSNRQWFGLTRGQFSSFVAVRVIVAAIAGGVIYAVKSSVVWLIVALLASGVVMNTASGALGRR